MNQESVQENDLKAWVQSQGFEYENAPLFWLEGPMGSGKSTLARAFLSLVGVPAERFAGSPTYTLMQRYELPQEHSALHVDLYRIETEDALFEMGLEAELQAGKGPVWVEWGDRFPEWQSATTEGIKAFGRPVYRICLERVSGDEKLRRLLSERL